MSLQDELCSPDRNIEAELSQLSDKVQEVYADGKLMECRKALVDYFSLIRYAHAYEVISDEVMNRHISVWGVRMGEMSRHSPITAYCAAVESLNICDKNQNGIVPCHVNIVNHCFLFVTANAYPGLLEHVKDSVNFPLSNTDVYLKPLISVVVASAPYTHDQRMNNTFFTALTQLEKMLFSTFVTPAKRFDMVDTIYQKIRDRKDCPDLTYRVHEIMATATLLPNGRGIILNHLEVQADEIAAETKAHKEQKPVSICVGRAIRSGVPSVYAWLHQGIEEAFSRQSFSVAQNKLYALFERMAYEDRGDDETEERIALGATGYFTKAATRLAGLSLSHGFNLASRCINAIDEVIGVPEQVQSAVYQFALPVLDDWEFQDAKADLDTGGLHQIMLRHISEFKDNKHIGSMFEQAMDGYEGYLSSLTPTVRYSQMKELSDWVAERRKPSPTLTEFVEDWMDKAIPYDGELGIPMDVDSYTDVLALMERAP